MLLGLIRIILLWWLISAFIKWLRRPYHDNNPFMEREPGNQGQTGVEFTGHVVDAEFEEIEKEQ